MLTSNTGQLHGSASFVNNNSVVPGHNSSGPLGPHAMSNLLGKANRSSSEPPVPPQMHASESTSSFQQRSNLSIIMKPAMTPKVEKHKTAYGGTEA